MRHLLITLLLVTAATATMRAYDLEVDSIYYNRLSATTVEVTYENTATYNGVAIGTDSYRDTVVIPETITVDGTDYTVVGIGNRAFYRCRLTGVVIPNTVTNIAPEAFGECSALTGIMIPRSVTFIGYDAFRGCPSLTSVEVDESNPVYDSRDHCNAIIKTASNELYKGCRTTVIPNTVTRIGNAAFAGDVWMTGIVIPQSVTAMGNQAFAGCTHMTRLVIPASVTSIGENAFYVCSRLESIKVEAGNTVYDSRNDCNAIIETVSNKLIIGCKNTHIPNTVKIIDTNAFSSRYGLTSVIVPNSVTDIYDFAFADCPDLTSIELPKSLVSFGRYTLDGSTNITRIICRATFPPFAEYLWYYNKTNAEGVSCYKQAKLFVPKESVTSYKNYPEWRKFQNVIALTNAGPGDVTGDGKINITDVTSLISLMLTGDDMPAYADVNNDGVVSIQDITALVNKILTGDI